MTADLHLVLAGINMKNIHHFSPIYNQLNLNRLIFGGRYQSKKYLILRLLDQQLPELEFNIWLDFPFIPKRIKKVKNRKVRRACYQSFKLYKNSFKPIRHPRLRMIMDEYPRYESNDHIDALAYAFTNSLFYSQYNMAWDRDTENSFSKGNIQNDE